MPDDEKRETVSYTLRDIPIDLYERIKQRAKDNGRSVHMQMQFDLKAACDAEKDPPHA